MQKFKTQENPNFFKDFVKDPTSMKCQVFIDCVSLFVLSIVLTIAAAAYGDFRDNFLPGFYLIKLIYLAFVYVGIDESKKNHNKKFLGFRIFFDLLMFVGGYFMMKGGNLDEMCYILYCTVILLNLSASTICVLVMGQEEPREEEDVDVQDNNGIQHQLTEEEDVESALIAKVKGGQNRESFVSGSTAATFFTRTTKV